MGQKNEYLVGLISKEFGQGADRLASHEAKTLQRDIDEINKKDDYKMQMRSKLRKQKEMEAKLFQDRQVAEKVELKNREKEAKLNEQQSLLKEVEMLNESEAKKKNDRMMKLKTY